MTVSEARQALMALQAKMSAYDHAMSVLFYDGSTTAPRGTAANRGRSLSILSEEFYRLSTGEETLSLLAFLDEHKQELPEAEQRMVYLLRKDILQMQKIPMDEYVAYRQLLVEADDVWHRAKENNDFDSFCPLLEQIFATTKRFAGYCAPDKDPYDYWLGEYEEGLTREVCDRFFATLRGRLVPLLQKIAEKPQVEDGFLTGSFPLEKQRELSRYLMDVLKLDPDHVGIGETEHPFTTSLGSHFDERITTHYHADNFSSSMYSVIHEGGHALYDTGSADELAYTVLDGGVSMGIHESQSRFYENLLGRSLPFVELVLPRLQELFPQLADVSPWDFYRAINKAEPSLIRTEADEVTYCLHIMVRYELEKQVMAGELAVRDLPAAWNRLYKEYLGVEVPDDRRGVLQDTHWSGGMIGYFPSYALGSAYGAQLMAKMRRTVDVDGCIRSGNLQPINDWNRAHIWQFGKRYPSNILLEQALGEAFDPAFYLDYLEKKCAEIYDI